MAAYLVAGVSSQLLGADRVCDQPAHDAGSGGSAGEASRDRGEVSVGEGEGDGLG